MKNILRSICLATLAICGLTAQAQTNESATKKPFHQVNLFVTATHPETPYRIPAIAKAHNGDLVAVSDYRLCGTDIGYGRVDLICRISKDNGTTWGKEFNIVQGSGIEGATNCGYGDAALVADSESNDLLLICVCGNTIYYKSKREAPMPLARLYSHDNGQTWSAPEEITNQIYGLFDNSKLGKVDGCFAGSGRICQSRIIKVGSHYRLYMALAAHPGGNRVIYSDDFGKTWAVLGGIDAAPAPKGDEPKCEELPNGTVVLSSRAWGGRFFNYYTYSNQQKAEGSWGKVTFSGEANNGTTARENACNGEILVVPALRNADGAEVYVALQSVPLGDKRANVGIYYKELSEKGGFCCPRGFSKNWHGCYQVSTLGSAYSTMCVQADGRIAFLYEEDTFGKDYTLVYKPYTLEDITAGAYTYCPTVNREAFVKRTEKAKM